MRTILALALALAAGCATTRGVHLGPAQLQQLRIGSSTYTDAVRVLGPPTTTVQGVNGRTASLWSYREARLWASCWVPVVGLFVCGSDITAEDTTLLFESDGTLAGIAGDKTPGRATDAGAGDLPIPKISVAAPAPGCNPDTPIDCGAFCCPRTHPVCAPEDPPGERCHRW